MQNHCNTIRRSIKQNKTVVLTALPHGRYRLLEVTDLPWGETELSSIVFDNISAALSAYNVASLEVM